MAQVTQENAGVTREHRKLDIAYEYLDRACDLYLAGSFFSALHLGGAAEEMFDAIIRARKAGENKISSPDGKIVLRRALPSPATDELIALIQKQQQAEGLSALSAVEIRKRLDRAKNKTKHATERNNKNAFELTVRLDIEREATVMLMRALLNYLYRLHYAPRGPIMHVWRKLFLSSDPSRAISRADD